MSEPAGLATPTPRGRSRFRSLLLVLIVNLAILGIGVAVVELIFGGWINRDSLNRLNLIRSATLQYEVSRLYPTPSPTITYTRDAYGLRGSFADPSEIDILTMGGSTTDQRYIRDGETWQDALQVRLVESGRKLVVANGGVDGQSSYGHVRNFDWWLPRVPGLQPRYVLFYVGVNDFYKEGADHHDALLDTMAGNTLTQQIKENSALVHLVRTLKGWRDAKRVQLVHTAVDFDALEWTGEPLIAEEEYDAFMRARLDSYRQRLRILASRTSKIGATPIFVTVPARLYRFRDGVLEGVTRTQQFEGRTFNGADYYRMLRRFDAVTIEACEEAGGICLDTVGDTTWEDGDFYDLVHMTPSGASKLGDYLFEALTDRLDGAGVNPH